ncbi:TPA: glycine cleavage system protein GcvH [Candidatus Woesearchaeota archaeon]|nr:glycine cleavage system protein GcvH [Candidatus Woesearchaeota archaeon]
MDNPDDRKYTKEHEWVKVENKEGMNATATVGITFHAQELLTDIVFVELPKAGKKVEQFKQLAVVESVKSVSDVFSPVSGEVTAANNELTSNPELINKDPYNAGWIAKLKIEDNAKLNNELNNLMSAEQYGEYLKTAAH